MEINTRRAGKVMILSLEGELDAYWAGEAEREVWGLVDKGYYWLVLDLAGLSYLSSGGLRALLHTHRRLVELGGQLALAAPRPYVRDVLSVSGLAQALSIFDTPDDAVRDLQVLESGGVDDWADAVPQSTSQGTYQLRALAPGSATLQVVGDPTSHLWSRATAEGLTSRSLAELGYGLAIGAPAPSATAAVERLGEMLTLAGTVLWLPGDGRMAPDFQTADLDGGRLSVHLLNGLWVQGGPQFLGRFLSHDPEGGASLTDWAGGLLELAPLESLPGVSGALGVAVRAELAEMWGVALKRVPAAGLAPANGQEISHRENIADWLHFPTEPAYSNYTLLAAGVLAANVGRPIGGHPWTAVFGEPERSAQAPLRIHLHGAAFRPVPELAGAAVLDEEIRHVVAQGELAAVAHLLPKTRVRSVLFGVWVL